MQVALVGVGGYGQIYARALLDQGAAHQAKLVAAADTNLTSPAAAMLTAAGTPLYSDQADIYRHHEVDCTVIVSPIQYHAAQTLLALRNNSHVLVEKPIAGTPEEAEQMLAAQKASGLTVAVGFQWSFCPVIQSIKRDVQAGRLGAPQRLRSLVLWPRDEAYYRRNSWAGREYTAGGLPVFDSPVNNAAAHFLHNMLFILGDRLDSSAEPATVRAELYRANAIESYDTAAIQVTTTGGVPVTFVTSHAVARSIGPVSVYEFEDATLTHADEGPFVAKFSDGREHIYGSPVHANAPDKLWSCLASIAAGDTPVCGLHTALPHSRVVAKARKHAGAIRTIPEKWISRTGPLVHVKGLEDLLQTCCERGQLPSEVDPRWADKPGQRLRPLAVG